MLTAILGLGGGGTRVAKEFHRWLEVTPRSSQVVVASVEDRTRDGWLYAVGGNNRPGFDTGVGFAILDAFTGDLERFSVNEGFPIWVTYQLASQQGFGGNRRGARAEIQRIQQEMVQPRSLFHRFDDRDGAVPLLDWLRESLRFGTAQMVVPCMSLVGGTGRGAYDFLRDYWSIPFEQAQLTMLVGVVPPLSELQNREYNREALDYLRFLGQGIQKEQRTSVVLASYDIAHSIYSSTGDLEKLEAVKELRGMLQLGFQRNDARMITSALGELSILPANTAAGQLPVDAGVLIGFLPLLSNFFGPFAKDSFKIGDIPKGLDLGDLKRHFGGRFVVPCYMEAQGSWQEASGKFERDIAHYHTLGVQIPNLLTWMTELALAIGSYVPIDVFSRPLSASRVRKVVAVVWSKEPLLEGQRNGVVEYLSLVHKVEPVVFYVDGNDPLKSYLKASKSDTDRTEIGVRLWLYVVLDNLQVVEKFVRYGGH